MAIDWLTASAEERKVLYQALKRLIDGSAYSWDQVYAAAFGRPFAAGAGYEDNFRAGKIDRKKAAALYRWIAEHHPQAARAIDAEIAVLHGREAVTPDWDRFLQDHATVDGLAIVPVPDKPTGIVAFADAEPLSGRPIRRGEHFVFRLANPVGGMAIAFQWTKGVWYPLPLQPGGLVAAVPAKPHFLPWDKVRAEPVPLSEDTDMGRHRFVVVVLPEAIDRAFLDGLKIGQEVPPASFRDLVAALLATGPAIWRAFRIAVQFTD